MKYVRFIVGTNREKDNAQTGIVTELRILQESGEIPSYEEEHIDEIFEWMNEAFPVPPFEEKQWHPDSISWFKDSAQELIHKFRSIIAILEQYDRPVRMITTDQPGIILYEDEFQIVARSNRF